MASVCKPTISPSCPYGQKPKNLEGFSRGSGLWYFFTSTPVFQNRSIFHFNEHFRTLKTRPTNTSLKQL